LKNETQRSHHCHQIGTLVEVPGNGVGVFDTWVTISYAEIGDLSVATKAEVGEAVIPDVGGNGGIGEFAIWGLGEGTVGGLVDDLDLADVGVVDCELSGIYGEGGVLVGI
jgi:hypothetical protein